MFKAKYSLSSLVWQFHSKIAVHMDSDYLKATKYFHLSFPSLSKLNSPQNFAFISFGDVIINGKFHLTQVTRPIVVEVSNAIDSAYFYWQFLN